MGARVRGRILMTPLNFRKKPVIIQAIQYDGTYTSIQRIEKEFPDIRTYILIRLHDDVSSWAIGTLEGKHSVSKGDWIIKGVAGEYYPCKPDIFEQTYEQVEVLV
jgi:hypothetical protein